MGQPDPSHWSFVEKNVVSEKGNGGFAEKGAILQGNNRRNTENRSMPGPSEREAKGCPVPLFS
jgi:hypothetical protein